ncbi:MAG: hypothetical protein JXA21_14185 [Anaerolineae bacterium]|nr:hypothetical protein [Anaerolineae bacterium]
MSQVNISEYQKDSPRRTANVRIWLWLFDAFVMGGLVVFFITAGLMSQVSDTFATQSQLSQTMAFSTLLDKLYPYHMGYIFGSQLLLALTIAIELGVRLKRWRIQQSVHPLSNG